MDLDNTETWTTKEGEILRLVDMTVSHRHNLLAWLRRNASKLQAAEINAGWRFLNCLNGEMAIDSVEREIDRLYNTPANEWIEDQPLVIKLKEMGAAVSPSLNELRTKLLDRVGH